MDPFYIALILYLLAVVLAILDIFVPSGGMLMILGGAAAVASILFGFRSSTTLGMAMLTIVAASFPVIAVLTVKIWPHTPIGRMIILKVPNSDKGPSTQQTELDALIGKVFSVDAPLLPAGHVKVGHRHVNAIAEHGIIEQGENVKVIAVRDRNLIVRPTREPLTVIPPPQSALPARPSATAIDGQTLSPTPKLLELDGETLDRELLERPAEDLGLDSLDK